MKRVEILNQLCRRADEFYARGDAFGGSGNLSVRIDDTIWITPTGSALKDLEPSMMAGVALDGSLAGRKRPSKEYPFHLAIYRARPDVNAVVHLHAPHTVGVSCLADLDETNPIPPLTPYFVMRVTPLGVVGYFKPGSDELATAVGEQAASCDCMLMRNHGLVCTGRTFDEAADRATELEETCRLYLILRGMNVKTLTSDEIQELESTFKSRAR